MSGGEGRAIVVAIDGPAGAGKSTLARALAERLGLPYLNTGSMYRAVARGAVRRGVSPSDGPALAEIAEGLRFRIDRALLIDGRDPGPDLETEDVEAVVSEVARHPEVRAVLRAEQRRLGAPGAVVEGRDIGTVVFPAADLKVFLEAHPDVRAARRRADRPSEEEVAAALDRRDARDDRTNPLVPAPDAVPVDTTGRSPEEVVAEVLALIRRRVGR